MHDNLTVQSLISHVFLIVFGFVLHPICYHDHSNINYGKLIDLIKSVICQPIFMKFYAHYFLVLQKF